MLKRWIPWQYLITKASRHYNFIDPVTLLARLRRFAQPSEVQEPIELLRAGFVFHARGLVNTKAIQHNLDWVWPFWVEKQFDPKDLSFIPRGFSFSHINLTHRNWTAVGHHDLANYPIVDPRGLVTPLFDGWSLDAWLVTKDNRRLFPSRLATVEQELLLEPLPIVVTRCHQDDLRMTSRLWVTEEGAQVRMFWRVDGDAPEGTTLFCSLRPYNPEGIQFVEDLAYDEAERKLVVNGEDTVLFAEAPSKAMFANYSHGDVSQRLGDDVGTDRVIHCDVGMATGAFAFDSRDDHGQLSFTVSIDLGELPTQNRLFSQEPAEPAHTWRKTHQQTATLTIPDQRMQFLYGAAVNTLGLLSAEDVVPGPYTYKRFWFRDACLMLHAMLCLGMEDRVAHALESFFGKQKRSGYFRSQEGEWDSNGQVLWTLNRFLQLTGRRIPEHWLEPVAKGAKWIERKRLTKNMGPHKGLLPPGFSAEHFGPNDYYYWDNFWGVAGLHAAANMVQQAGKKRLAKKLQKQADRFLSDIWRSIHSIPIARSRGAMPASPYRRFDAGAIGCLVTDYPLLQVGPNDKWIANTREQLIKNCFHQGAFFQDMIHSGINAYLTLTVAQSMLRSGDFTFRELVGRVAELASPTGQWPEAIHPATGGGCMGDGQHGWAAAEWVMMIRNMFIMEERDRLVFGAGIFPEWLTTKSPLRFGPSPTPWGNASFLLHYEQDQPQCTIEAEWREQQPPLELRIPGFSPAIVEKINTPYPLTREEI